MRDGAQTSTILSGRGILITGGSTGIGKAIAKACVRAGADVAICGRRRGALETAEGEIAALSQERQKVVAIATDVADSRAVADMVAHVAAELPNFDGLVNCAGILGAKGLLDEVDVEEWIATIRVNLIGTMLTCRAVLQHFRARGYGKIVNVSGGGATSPRPHFSAYAASKAGVVRFTETLAEELDGSGICVNAIAPGAVNTCMLDEVLQAGAEKVGEAAFEAALRQKAAGGVPAERAAGLCVMLLSRESDGMTGKLISAVWDSWETLPARKDELAQSDVFTLRRIVPGDRGLDWA